MNAADALEIACDQVGLDRRVVTLIRAGENTLFRLPNAVVARVTREGQLETAKKETRVSRWLHDAGIAVVEVLPGVQQPVEVADRAVTFWRELPEHRKGTIDDVADVLRRLHRLEPPDHIHLPPLQPFVRLESRINEATSSLSARDRTWLLQHLNTLQDQYARLSLDLVPGAVHGDAWAGNIVSTADGPIILDLERFAVGSPEWDLTSIAVDHFTFGSLTEHDWRRFCDRYGYDVTQWEGYEVLRDARELRKVTFAAQMAEQHANLAHQAKYRLACIRGEHGSRPWHWTPVP